MRGVAQQRRAATCPAAGWLTVAENPVAPCFDLLEHRANLRPRAFEVAPEKRSVSLLVPAFRVVVGMEHGDKVHQFAAPQGIMHQMQTRPGPENNLLPSQLRWHVLHRKNRAIGDVAGDERPPIVDELRANRTPKTVGTDQGLAPHPSSALNFERDARLVLREGDGALPGLKRDAVLRLTGLEQRGVQIRAMDDRIGIAEPLDETRTKRNPHHLMPIQRGAHHQRIGLDGCGQDRVAQAKPVEHAEDVGAKLDPGAHFVELRCPLKQMNRAPFPRQRQGRAEPTDAAADDQERIRAHATSARTLGWNRSSGAISRAARPSVTA